MAKATWEGAILAESDNCVQVEGNYYFPPDSVNLEYFKSSSESSHCPWKGDASYHDTGLGSPTRNSQKSSLRAGLFRNSFFNRRSRAR